jgi:hypothetical protein
MMGNFNNQKNEVERLSAAAGLAAERERDQRTGLVTRGRRLVKSGMVIGLAAVTGFTLVAVFRRDDDDGRKKRNRKGDDSGVVALAGNRVLQVMQLALGATHLWNAASAAPEAPPAAESIQGG